MIFLEEKDQYGVVHFVTLDDIQLINGFVQEDIERRQEQALSAEQSSYSHVAVYKFPSQSKHTPGASSSSRDNASHRHEEWQASSSTSAYDTSAPYATSHQHMPLSANSAQQWHHGGWSRTENRAAAWTSRQEAWSWNNTDYPYTWEGYGPASNPRSRLSQFPYKGTRGDARERYSK